MAQDNTLGSPTEGLGANITFAGSGGRGGVPQMQAPGQGKLQVGGQARFNLTTNVASLGAAPAPDPTLGLVMKVAGQVLAPAIKRYQTEQFVSGMQRAAQGEAVTDIVNEQPWYSKIFGDSDVVEGARAYTQQAKATETAMRMTDNMLELRKMDGQTAQKHFTDTMMGAMTGDAATDAAVMKSLTSTMPAVMKQQAKEHYGYLQEEASKAESSAIMSGAQRLQESVAALREGKINQDDFDALKADLSWLAVPANGRDPVSAAAQRVSDLSIMAEKGQFHALNVLEDMGLVAMLDTKQQAQYIRAREINESQWRAKNSAPYIERAAALTRLSERGVAGFSGEDMILAVQELNTDYMADTGSRAPLFDPAVVAGYGERYTQAVQAVIDAEVKANATNAAEALKVGDKQAAEAFQGAAIMTAWKAGAVSNATLNDGITQEKVHKAVAQELLPEFQQPAKLTPETVNAVTANAITGYVNPYIKRAVSAVVQMGTTGGTPNAGFAESYNLWSKMQAGGGAVHYFDAPTHNQFLEFSMIHPDPIDPRAPQQQTLAAFDVTFGVGAKSGQGRLDKKEIEAATKNLKAEFSSWWPEMLGGDRDIRPEQLRRLTDAVTPMAELYGRLHSTEDATRIAVQVAKNAGHQVVGGYYLRDPENPQLVNRLQRELAASKIDFALPTGDEFGEYIGTEFDELLSAAGGKGADPVITVHGGTLNFTWASDDGSPKSSRITFNQLAQNVAKRAKARRPARGSLEPYTGGPNPWSNVPRGVSP